MNKTSQTSSQQPATETPSAAPSQTLPPSNSRWYAALAMVAAVAFGLRLIYLWQLQHAPLHDLVMGDALAYYRWSLKLAAGHWVGSDVFYQAPLYPYFLGVIHVLWGGDLLGIRLIQILLGTLACVLLAMTGRAMFNPLAGLIAGLMLGCYPTAIFFDGLIQKSALDLPLLCMALLLLVRGRQQPVAPFKWTSLTWWAGSGVALALLMLCRENALIFVAAAGAWALLPAREETAKPTARQSLYAGMSRAGVLLVALTLTLAPVIIRNEIVGGEFHLTTSQFGSNLYIGNHHGADGTYQPLRFGRGDAAYERTDAIELAQQRTGQTLTPGEVSTYWTGQVIDFIRHEPAAFLKLIGRKTMLMFNAVEITDTEGQYAYSDYARVLRWLGWWQYGLLLPLAMAGVVLGAKEMRKQWLLPLCMVLYAASVIAFFVFARYRLPIVPLLMLAAAAGLAELPDTLQKKDQRTLLYACGALVVTAILAWWPMVTRDDQRAISYASFARASVATKVALNQQPATIDIAQAQAFYRKAIDYAPSYAAAHYNLGVLLLEAGQVNQAIEALQASVQLKADLPDAWNQLGLANMQLGQSRLAIAAYQQAVHFKPDFAQAHNNLGVALARQGLLEAAVQQYRLAIIQDPGMAEAHNNLGTTLARQGDLPGAITSLKAALKIDPTYQDAQANLTKALRLYNSSQNDTH